MLKKIIRNYLTAIRRVSLPLSRHHLVIDLGSGGAPNPWADVAVEAIETNSERDAPLKIDRPFVWAYVDALPFKDKVFDFSILSHVLEHLVKPKEALEEVERISKAGYIETPNAFYEIAIPHTYHVSRCTVVDGVLNITFKTKWDETLPNGYQDVGSDVHRLFWFISDTDPRMLLTRYFWKCKIDFRINGQYCNFEKHETDQGITKKSLVRMLATKFVYWVYRPRKRIVLEDMLCCPSCKGTLTIGAEVAECTRTGCSQVFHKYRGYWDFRCH